MFGNRNRLLPFFSLHRSFSLIINSVVSVLPSLSQRIPIMPTPRNTRGNAAPTVAEGGTEGTGGTGGGQGPDAGVGRGSNPDHDPVGTLLRAAGVVPAAPPGQLGMVEQMMRSVNQGILRTLSTSEEFHHSTLEPIFQNESGTLPNFRVGAEAKAIRAYLSTNQTVTNVKKTRSQWHVYCQTMYLATYNQMSVGFLNHAAEKKVHAASLQASALEIKKLKELVAGLKADVALDKDLSNSEAFTSKAMSVIINPEGGRLLLFTFGFPSMLVSQSVPL